MAEGLNQMIALHGRGLNLDPAGQVGRGQQLMAGFQDLQMQPLRKKEAELRLAALEQQNAAHDDEFKIRDLATDAIKIKPLLESGDLTRANTMIAERIQKIMQRGGDPADTMAFRDALNSKQITPQQAAAELGLEIEAAQRSGIFSQGNLASSRTYEPVPMYENGKFTGMGIPTFDPRTGQARYTPIQGGQTVDPATLAGMKAGSSQTAQNVSDLAYKPLITSATENEKIKVQTAKLPDLRAAIKSAEKQAAAKGEAFTDLNRMQAAMPGLMQAVDNLRDLSGKATFTMGGRLFDTAAKELGFGGTEGATARTKYISIINNQVLPLLKQTFGSVGITDSDRQSLINTFGDPDVSPEEKMATLDALIEQKARDLEAKQAEVGGAKGNSIDPALLEFMTPEERALFK